MQICPVANARHHMMIFLYFISVLRLKLNHISERVPAVRRFIFRLWSLTCKYPNSPLLRQLKRPFSCLRITLEWHHMSAMVSQIISNLAISSKVCSDQQQIIRAPLYWLFVRGVHWWPVDSSHIGPVMRKTFQCHEATIACKTLQCLL